MEDNNNNNNNTLVDDMEEDPARVEFEEEQDNIHDEEDEDDDDDDDYEEDEDDDDDDDDDDDEDEEVEELILSETTSRSSITGGLVDASNECHRKLVIKKNGGDDEEKKEMKRDEFDVCSICFESWTSGGDHRICCLPCGHIYGMSCIRKWLMWCQGDGKCPKCKSLCTSKDIRVLYATRLGVVDEKPHEASPINFPYTREGFSEFQQYVFSCMDELKQRIISLEQRAEDFDSRLHILQQICDELRAQVPESSR